MAPGGTREQVSRPRGSAPPTLHPGAPRSPPPRPADPSRPLRERRGRTASRGGEPEVQGGAPGNPSRSEPGRCGWEEEGGARWEVSRAEPGAAEAPPPPPSRLLAASETAHFASRLWTAAGRLPHPRSQGAQRTWSHPAPAHPSRRPRPSGGNRDPALKRTPRPRRGVSPGREGRRLSASVSASGVQS